MRRVVLSFLLVAACTVRKVDSVSIRGGETSDRRTLAASVNETERIWRSAAFWDLVESYVWIPKPGADPIDGAKVRKVLEAHRPAKQEYWLVWFFGKRVWTAFYSSATAETTPCRRVEILRRRVPATTLVGTVAHENTHLAVDEKCQARYLDGDYSAYEVPWLVSYGIGDLALCFASTGTDPGRTNQCFGQIVNGSYACRTHRQCCAGGASVPENIKKARAVAPQCRASCEDIEALCNWFR